MALGRAIYQYQRSVVLGFEEDSEDTVHLMW